MRPNRTFPPHRIQHPFPPSLTSRRHDTSGLPRTFQDRPQDLSRTWSTPNPFRTYILGLKVRGGGGGLPTVADMQSAVDKVNNRLKDLRSDEEHQRSTEDQIAAAQKELIAAQVSLQAAKDSLASKIESLLCGAGIQGYLAASRDPQVTERPRRKHLKLRRCNSSFAPNV